MISAQCNLSNVFLSGFPSMYQTDNAVKKSKAKSCIDQDIPSVDSPAVDVVFGRADPVCFETVMPSLQQFAPKVAG